MAIEEVPMSTQYKAGLDAAYYTYSTGSFNTNTSTTTWTVTLLDDVIKSATRVMKPERFIPDLGD